MVIFHGRHCKIFRRGKSRPGERGTIEEQLVEVAWKLLTLDFRFGSFILIFHGRHCKIFRRGESWMGERGAI
jgi:hypothetical protein